MRRSAYFATLAALLAGTAVAGPHGSVFARAARPACCSDGPGRPASPPGARSASFDAADMASRAEASGLRGTQGAAAAMQAPSAPETSGPAGEPDPDAAAIDALIATLYATVSGPAGARRDWQALARLHAPGARLHLTRADAEGRLAVRSLDFAGFVAEHEARFAARGFHEREIAREVAGFGGVRHVWSTFEARREPGDAQPYARGVNSLQLVRTAEGWRLVSATWDFERPGLPLPARIAPSTEAAR